MKFIIKRLKMELKIPEGFNEEIFYPTCSICGQKIEKGDRVVYIPTSSWYANWKGYFIAHEECFLKELYELFKDKISLKKRAKKEIMLREL